MLSYQHAYHAGNPADLHKHIVLAELLALLRKKPRGITYFETHAGRGAYDLSADEARKTGEAAYGIARLSLDPTTAYGAAVQDFRSREGETAYPGSPFIALHGARAEDRVILMEKHPGEGAALKTATRATLAEVHLRDGYEGVLGSAPPTPRKGLVLIDPSYEQKSEYDQVASFTPKLMKKWPEATILIWYPLLPAARHEQMFEALAPLSPVRHEVHFQAKEGHRMTGSGLLLISAPYGSEACFEAALQQTEGVLVSA